MSEMVYHIIKPVEKSEIQQNFDELEKTIEIYEHISGREDEWIKDKKEDIKHAIRATNNEIIKMMQLKRPPK